MGTYHKTGQAKGDHDGFPREGGQVVGHFEVSAVVGQQHAIAHGRQRLDALDEGVLLDAVVICPVQEVPALQTAVTQK